MMVGDLVKRIHKPYDYGIIVFVSSRSVFVSWVGDSSLCGYSHNNVSLSIEVIK